MGAIRTTILGFALAALCTGCGGKAPLGPTLEGKLTKEGKPLQVHPMVGWIEMNLVPAGEPTADPQSASVDKKDGSYKIRGTKELGIKPGKYKVVVRQFDEKPEVDLLNGKFSKEKTPIEVEVTAQGGVQKFDVELSKYK